MNAADKLREQLKNKNAKIIAERIEPNKETLLNAIARGIERIGYVEIDTLHNTSTYEGRQIGFSPEPNELDALAEFLTAEGFKVSKMWWGYSSNGFPDMLKIKL